MKKTIIALLGSMVLLSCTCNTQNESITYIKKPVQNTSECNDVKIVEIDSCEYIQYHLYNYEAVTHKGNCKYCIERAKHLK